ncbi:M23 peptidase domain protein [Synechococcus sp. PCC 7335]|uniref:peptidoglycan DD-metalloendopeptidase family protein n=1 Tax=Synechococcus sp. (strain ATCC 29403 / PCC 7335) TaxID=91464 RepID=UPI00017EE413|nr:M23 peptidase domain protein [Synechococcus sp. PCC 7335]
MSDSSHSCIQETRQSAASSRSIKSAAVLGLALSVGASGVFTTQSEASAAVSTPRAPATAKAFSSVQLSKPAASASQSRIVAHHTVESGQSLWQIAQLHRVGLHDLKTANNLSVEPSIRVGQVLKVPGAAVAAQSPTQKVIQSLIAREPEPIELAANSLALENAETIAKAKISNQSQSAEELSANSQADLQPVPQLDQVQAAFKVANTQAGGQVDSPTELFVKERGEPAAARAEAREAQPSAAIEPSDPAGIEEIEVADASFAGASESSPVVATLTSPTPPSVSYQVQAGDTLAGIASSLGMSTAALISANDLANPDVIMPGATLVIPTANSPQVARRDIRTGSTLEQTAAKSRLDHLQSTAIRQDASVTEEELQSKDSSSSQNVIATDAQVAAAQGGIDPYVASLLEEVQEIQSQPVQVSEAQITEVEASVSNSPRVAERVSEQIAITPTATEPADSTLLAAAPLSPEAYVPAQRSPAGQVVSPDMPLLPEADEFLPEAPNYFDGYIWPARGTLTSGYGWRWGRMHRGVDVAGPVGTPIVAAGSGIVEKAGWNSGGYGNLVEIRHPDGSLTLYAHNNRLNVSTGQAVKQGQKIAEMGSTGYSTGPHLHFEVHVSGRGAVNPIAYLPNR